MGCPESGDEKKCIAQANQALTMLRQPGGEGKLRPKPAVREKARSPAGVRLFTVYASVVLCWEVFPSRLENSAMAKAKRLYGCTECGATFPSGRASAVSAAPGKPWWNRRRDLRCPFRTRRLGRSRRPSRPWPRSASRKPRASPPIPPNSTGCLGGGLVDGSVVLIGGDPGIGKSTICCRPSATWPRACRRSMSPARNPSSRWPCVPAPGPAGRQAQGHDRDLHRVHRRHRARKSRGYGDRLHPDHLHRAAAVRARRRGQVRESAALLVRFAKQTGTAIFLVGHVTKEGALAGPRVLEHMVDTVLYFEGESDAGLRMLESGQEPLWSRSRMGCSA